MKSTQESYLARIHASEDWMKISDYIESLDDEAKDRILEAQEWKACGSWRGAPKHVPRCLIQHADEEGYWNRTVDIAIGCAFDDLCVAYPTSIVVHACKAKAAEGRKLSEFESTMKSEAVRTQIRKWYDYVRKVS